MVLPHFEQLIVLPGRHRVRQKRTKAEDRIVAVEQQADEEPELRDVSLGPLSIFVGYDLDLQGVCVQAEDREEDEHGRNDVER